jgi:hypothetical protein
MFQHNCSSIVPDVLAKQWGTSLDIAEKTLQVTTQAVFDS